MRFSCLLLASLSALPSVASAATIDLITIGKPINLTVADIRTTQGSSDELSGGWLDGQPAGANPVLNWYFVDVLTEQSAEGTSAAGTVTDVNLLADDLSLRHDSSLGSRFYVSYLRTLTTGGCGSSSGSPWCDTPPRNDEDHITSTPEPATLLLLVTGIAGLATRGRHKSQS